MKTKYQIIAMLMLLFPLSSIAQSSTVENTITTGAQKPTPLSLSAMLENNRLFISGNFETGKLYEVVVYDTFRQKVYSKSFEGSHAAECFDIDEELKSGKYTIAIRLKGEVRSGKDITML
jgi:hypothetical protein